MRSKLGTLCMILGALLILGAVGLVLHNQRETTEAEAFAEDLVPMIQEEILQALAETPTEQSLPAEILENTPETLLRPEDLLMTEKIIRGYAYIGYLTIPELDLELPVMSGWDSKRLQISPCRFTGTLKGEDLVIMAHNYNSHFGRLSKLSEGSQIQFTDMDGNLWDYTVAAMDILPAEAVEEMTAGEYDLSLFTCAPNRTQRVTVRCNFAHK